MNNIKFRQSIHSPPHSVLRKFWLDRRQKLGLSQRALAKKLRVPHSLICKVETGDRRLDVVEFVNYLPSLRIDPCEVLKIIKNNQ